MLATGRSTSDVIADCQLWRAHYVQDSVPIGIYKEFRLNILAFLGCSNPPSILQYSPMAVQIFYLFRLSDFFFSGASKARKTRPADIRSLTF